MFVPGWVDAKKTRKVLKLSFLVHGQPVRDWNGCDGSWDGLRSCFETSSWNSKNPNDSSSFNLNVFPNPSRLGSQVLRNRKPRQRRQLRDPTGWEVIVDLLYNYLALTLVFFSGGQRTRTMLCSTLTPGRERSNASLCLWSRLVENLENVEMLKTGNFWIRFKQ